MTAEIEEGWLRTGRHSRCPACLSVDGLKMKLVSSFDLYPASLAGMQMKFGARETVSWWYRCFDCGDEGPCSLKTPEQQGKWIDGLGSEPYE